MSLAARLLSILAVLPAMLLPAIPPAVAQQTPQLCAAVVADAERLACYDALFRTGEPTTPAERLVIPSQQLIPAIPTGRRPAEMILACGPSGVVLNLTFAGQVLVETSQETAVTFQRDLGAQQTRNLPATADDLGVGFASPADTDMFLNQLAGVRTLRVRITPPRQRSLVVDFRIADQVEAIAALRQSCG